MSLKDRIRPVYHRLKATGRKWRYRLGWFQDPATLVRDAGAYWEQTGDTQVRQNAHWRGQGLFEEDRRWLDVGAEHLKLYESMADMVGQKRPVRKIVEWGCGGGANAVHFLPITDEFIGVDIAQPTLDECARQCDTTGLGARFRAVLANVDQPETAARTISGPVDVFLCTYVFELIPSQEYGQRLLQIARGLLAPGGVAVIQIKYATDDWRTVSRKWAYAKDVANMTSYRIEEFWEVSRLAGLTPRAVVLKPRQPLVNDERYAYFLLTAGT